MTTETYPLTIVYDGWASYHTSIVHAITPLSLEQLRYRPETHLRSVGELASHIALGRIDWFARMDAPGSAALAQQLAALGPEASIAENKTALLNWLDSTWQMIDQTLRSWTVADLTRTYRHTYYGNVYAISYQWTLWRIMAHDIHHGGELAVMLGMQGVAVAELGDLGGHLNQPPLVEPA